MTHVKMPGEIPVVDRLHKLFKFILRFAKEPIEVRELPGNQRNEDNEINKLGLNDRYGSQAEYRENEYNTDEYAEIESF